MPRATRAPIEAKRTRCSGVGQSPGFPQLGRHLSCPPVQPGASERQHRTTLSSTTKQGLRMQDQELEYVGFWARVGASIIDSIIILLVSIPLLVTFYGWGYFTNEEAPFIAGPADFLISW